MFSLRKAGVLVIDDGSSVADILAMVLNASGFDATAVYSGETELEIVSLRAFDNVGTRTRHISYSPGLSGASHLRQRAHI